MQTGDQCQFLGTQSKRSGKLLNIQANACVEHGCKVLEHRGRENRLLSTETFRLVLDDGSSRVMEREKAEQLYTQSGSK